MMNKVLLIGAGSDITRPLISELDCRNFVLTTHRSPDNFDPLRKDAGIRDWADHIEIVKLDARDADSHQQILESVLEGVDCVICLAGYLGDQDESRHNWTKAADSIDINYKGVVSILLICANHMEKQGKGTIVGVTSVAGLRGRQSNYPYGSAKAGLIAYLSGLRNYISNKGVHVVTVIPGYIQTKMTEGMNLPGPLTASPELVAKRISKAIRSKKNIIYVKSIWRWIMLIIRSIPESMFKRLKL